MNIPNRIPCCKTRFVHHAYTIRDNVVFRDGNLLVVIHVRDGNYDASYKVSLESTGEIKSYPA